MKRLVILLVFVLGNAALAAETAHQATGGSHPVLPEPSAWPGALVIVILWMFIAAAGVGVVVRLNAPQEEPPPDESHHDDHGHGHGH